MKLKDIKPKLIASYNRSINNTFVENYILFIKINEETIDCVQFILIENIFSVSHKTIFKDTIEDFQRNFHLFKITNNATHDIINAIFKAKKWSYELVYNPYNII